MINDDRTPVFRGNCVTDDVNTTWLCEIEFMINDDNIHDNIHDNYIIKCNDDVDDTQLKWFYEMLIPFVLTSVDQCLHMVELASASWLLKCF